MPQKIQISIPEPCHENWDKMTPTDQGRFCSTCQHEVIDFSRMSDRQVAQFFNKPSEGSTCGRFLKDQLDRDIDIDKKRIPWVKYFFQLLIPTFLVAKQLKAQGGPMLGRKAIAITERAKPGKAVIKLDSLVKRLKLKVIDSITRKPIANAFVIEEKSNFARSTNEWGLITISLKRETKDVELTITAKGYQPRLIKGVPTSQELRTGMVITLIKEVEEQEPDKIVVCQLQKTIKDTTIVVRPAAATTTTETKVAVIKKVFDTLQRITNTVKKWVGVSTKTIKVYPNPVQAGTLLNMEFDKPVKGTYVFELINAAGAVVSRKEIVVYDEMNTVMMEIPVVAAGVYFLSINQPVTGNKFRKEIIVQ